VVVAAGHVRFPSHIVVGTAADAAEALRPLAGAQTGLRFSVGLLGASLLAATVMPLSTSYAICEAFGWESGISKNFGEAPVFMGLFTLLLVAGGIVVVLFPQHLLIQLILVSQAINGLLLPIVLAFILRLASDRSLMGGSANGRTTTAICWGDAGLAALRSFLSSASPVRRPSRPSSPPPRVAQAAWSRRSSRGSSRSPSSAARRGSS